MNQCKVKITDGKIAIGRENVRDLVRSKKDGHYAFTLKKWTRTLAQNNTMWDWIKTLRQHHGYSKKEMYDALIQAYSWPYTFRGLDGKPRQGMVTTSMMSVDEMSHFMECIVQHAAEENVTLRMPKEEKE